MQRGVPLLMRAATELTHHHLRQVEIMAAHAGAALARAQALEEVTRLYGGDEFVVL